MNTEQSIPNVEHERQLSELELRLRRALTCNDDACACMFDGVAHCPACRGLDTEFVRAGGLLGIQCPTCATGKVNAALFGLHILSRNDWSLIRTHGKIPPADGSVRTSGPRQVASAGSAPGDGAADEIEVNGRFRWEITNDCLAALHRANGNEPFIFRRGTEIVRVAPKALAVERLTREALSGVLDRAARFIKVTAHGENEHRTPARPPADVVADLMSLPDLGLPILADFRHAPVFVLGDRLICQPGYDAESGVYLAPSGLGEVSADMPQREALDLLLEELLSEFPFADDAACAHTVGLLILPFVRPLIDGPTPLHLIDAPTPGTGKGLLADVFEVIALGRPAEVMVLNRDGDEIEKRITALLVSAAPSVLLDNVTARLEAAPLAAALTTTSWRGRILGESRMVEVPNRATWIATGNNVAVSDEIARRTVPIRLDAGTERPEERTAWRHPDLLQWAKENRSQLVSACLSLVRAWLDAGAPPGDWTLGRFESWARTIGGILQVSGVSGFSEGRGRLHSDADQETQEWCAFCRAWWTAFEEHPVTAGDLFAVAKERSLLLYLWGGRGELAAKQKIGHALLRHRDRVFAGFVIKTAGRDSDTGSQSYRLVRRDRQTPETHETRESRYERGGVSTDSECKTPVNPDTDSSEEQGVSGISGVSMPHLTAGIPDAAARNLALLHAKPGGWIGTASELLAELGEVTCDNRTYLLERGEERGYPSISWTSPDGECSAWPEGETAWRNRCRLAEPDELRSALEALLAGEARTGAA